MQKLYCYVDETGQDTNGEFFLVAAVVIGQDRDAILPILETIERQSGKNKVKWVRARESFNQAYMEAVLAESCFKGRLSFAVYRNSTEYLQHRVQATQLAISKYAEERYKATIIVDGLQGKQVRDFRNLLRIVGIRFKTVRGIRDEADAFVRLADAVCGFTRNGLAGHAVFAPMLEDAFKRDCILPLL